MSRKKSCHKARRKNAKHMAAFAIAKRMNLVRENKHRLALFKNIFAVINRYVHITRKAKNRLEAIVHMGRKAKVAAVDFFKIISACKMREFIKHTFTQKVRFCLYIILLFASKCQIKVLKYFRGDCYEMVFEHRKRKMA